MHKGYYQSFYNKIGGCIYFNSLPVNLLYLLRKYYELTYIIIRGLNKDQFHPEFFQEKSAIEINGAEATLNTIKKTQKNNNNIEENLLAEILSSCWGTRPEIFGNKDSISQKSQEEKKHIHSQNTIENRQRTL